jgi:hypothetical protein
VGFIFIIIVILLALVLCGGATRVVLVLVTTAPPHLYIVTVWINMILTTPVEVLFFSELIVALNTSLDTEIYFSLTIFHLDQALLHLVAFVQQILALFF